MTRRVTSSSSAGIESISVRTIAHGFVDQVDGLVGQEAVGDVAVGERGGRDERVVLDADAVMDLVALLETSEDRDRVFDALVGVYCHGLEAALERRVLLDVAPMLVERRRADAVQLAAGQHGLEQVPGVGRALCAASADDVVDLVDEQEMPSLRSP